MTKKQSVLLILMALVMIGTAIMMGNWSKSLNPDGIVPHPTTDANNEASIAKPRDAFSFGMSIGLLGIALLYSCIAFGLFIQSKAHQRPVSKFIYYLAALAGTGFALSYVVDDYFY